MGQQIITFLMFGYLLGIALGKATQTNLSGVHVFPDELEWRSNHSDDQMGLREQLDPLLLTEQIAQFQQGYGNTDPPGMPGSPSGDTKASMGGDTVHMETGVPITPKATIGAGKSWRRQNGNHGGGKAKGKMAIMAEAKWRIGWIGYRIRYQIRFGEGRPPCSIAR